jgi:hypothetical protein
MLSAPILNNKDPDASSVFEPAALLREARRQKGLSLAEVPALCILDPDGDIVRRLKNSGHAKLSDRWPCYHTELYEFSLAGKTAGIIGCAVGAPFAVLVAEELFACGCRMLISVTSAGQINPMGDPPYFVVIERALRDEGTSYHYAAPDIFAEADTQVVKTAIRALTDAGLRAHVGTSWTTDAPFRETANAVAAARTKARSLSKWRLLRSTRSRAGVTRQCFVSRTSPIRWGWQTGTLKRRGRRDCRCIDDP